MATKAVASRRQFDRDTEGARKVAHNPQVPADHYATRLYGAKLGIKLLVLHKLPHSMMVLESHKLLLDAASVGAKGSRRMQVQTLP